VEQSAGLGIDVNDVDAGSFVDLAASGDISGEVIRADGDIG
jgi:hypothetical protein